MRRLIALLAVLVLAAALPTTTLAARASRFTDHVVGISCEGILATSGSGFVFLGANTSSEFGPDAFVDFWSSDEPEGDPDLTRDFDQPAQVTWDGTTLEGSIALVDASGNPAGSATFSARLTPAGDPLPFSDRFREGNHWHDFSGVDQPMAATGTLTIGGATFALSDCFGNATTVTVFETNPKSFVARFVDRNVGCDLLNSDGDTGFLFADLQVGDVFIDAFATASDGSSEIESFTEGTLVNGVLDTSLDAFDIVAGEPVAGSIHLAIVGTGDPIEFVLKTALFRELVRGQSLDLEGTLTLGSMTFDLGACVGIDVVDKVIATAASGPKPGGKVPSNDLPSGAKLLRPGDRTSVATKGASPGSEAPFPCLTPDGEVIPVAHTVWYKLVGTGGALTVDTAGSDYDTVVAVYTAGASGGFTPLADACVDDVPVVPIGRTLQAAVTWQSAQGTTYYVQIGGFPQDFPYGNLRVAAS